MSQTPHVLAHDAKDNVAVVVVEGLQSGTDMFGVTTENNSEFHITALADIPIGHKVALVDMQEGDTVIKYGEDIGKIIQAVNKGEHVHTHNLKTKRW